MTEEYLGDGVYATWDDGVVTLDLRAQSDGTVIVLEPEVYRALLRFVDRCAPRSEQTVP